MEKQQKPVKGTKSMTYDVRYNNTIILAGHPNLEEAISFAYNLHRSTLSTLHEVRVLRHDWRKIASPYCILCTENYFDSLEAKIDAKDPLDSDDLPEYWQGHDGE